MSTFLRWCDGLGERLHPWRGRLLLFGWASPIVGWGLGWLLFRQLRWQPAPWLRALLIALAVVWMFLAIWSFCLGWFAVHYNHASEPTWWSWRPRPDAPRNVALVLNALRIYLLFILACMMVSPFVVVALVLIH